MKEENVIVGNNAVDTIKNGDMTVILKQILEVNEKTAKMNEKTANEIEALKEKNAKLELALKTPASKLEVGATREEEKKFKSVGDWVITARKHHNREIDDVRIKAMNSSVGADGGYLVPDEILDEILRIQPTSAIVRPRARVIPATAGENNAKMHIVALQQGDNGYFGGVVAGKKAELAEIVASAPKFDKISLQPESFGALIPVPNGLLNSASGLSAFLPQILREAMAETEDNEFLVGNGVSGPVGLLKSPDSSLTVTRQTPGTITYKDITDMVQKCTSKDPNRIKILCTNDGYSTLHRMVDDAKNRVMVNGRIDNIEVIYSDKLSALGTAGDIAVVDFRNYIIKDGYRPAISFSEHVNFNSDETVFKAIWYFDGKLWNKEPLTLRNKTKIAPVVTLK